MCLQPASGLPCNGDGQSPPNGVKGRKFEKMMPRNILGTVVKLLLASLAVGLVLSALNITSSKEVFARIGELARYAVDTGGDLAAWSFGYIVLGAAVVVPVWLVIALFRRLRRR
jgi:hypothetical protein